MITLFLLGALAFPPQERPITEELIKLREEAHVIDARRLERIIFKHEIENEATRVIADNLAEIAAGGLADIASTGWAIAEGKYEGNPLLGGDKNSALIIIGTKGLLLVAQYKIQRATANTWKACMLENYDKGRFGDCSQLDRLQKNSRLFTIVRLLLTGWNTYKALESPEVVVVK